MIYCTLLMIFIKSINNSQQQLLTVVSILAWIVTVAFVMVIFYNFWVKNSYFWNNLLKLTRRKWEHTKTLNKIPVLGTSICYWFFRNRYFTMNWLSQALSSYILLTRENGTEQECFKFQTILEAHLMIFIWLMADNILCGNISERLLMQSFLFQYRNLVLWLNCTCILNTK